MLIKELVDLNEGKINVNILMMMDEIINAGKITNNAQCIQLASVLSLLKNGDITTINSFNGAPASGEMITALKTASDADVVGMATYAKAALSVYNGGSYASFINPSLQPVEWMNYVLQKQD